MGLPSRMALRTSEAGVDAETKAYIDAEFSALSARLTELSIMIEKLEELIAIVHLLAHCRDEGDEEERRGHEC